MVGLDAQPRLLGLLLHVLRLGIDGGAHAEVKGAGDTVHLPDPVGQLTHPVQQLLELPVVLELGEDDEVTAADTADGGKLTKFLQKVRGDGADEVVREVVAVEAAHVGEVVHSDVHPDEVGPAQVVLVPVGGQSFAQAAGVEHAGEQVRPGQAMLQVSALLHLRGLGEEAQKAADLAVVVIDGHFAGHDGPVLAVDDAVARHVPGLLAELDDVLLVGAVQVRVDVPAQVLVSLAQNLAEGGETVKVQKALAGAQEAPVLVLPEQLQAAVADQIAPQHGHGQTFLGGGPDQVGGLLGVIAPEAANFRLRVPQEDQHRAGAHTHQGELAPAIARVLNLGAEMGADILTAGADDTLLHGGGVHKLEVILPVLGENPLLPIGLDGVHHFSGRGGSGLLVIHIQRDRGVLVQVQQGYPVVHGVDVAQRVIQRVLSGDLGAAGQVVQPDQEAPGVLAHGKALGGHLKVFSAGDEVHLPLTVGKGLIQQGHQPGRHALLDLGGISAEDHLHQVVKIAPVGTAHRVVKGLVGEQEQEGVLPDLQHRHGDTVHLPSGGQAVPFLLREEGCGAEEVQLTELVIIHPVGGRLQGDALGGDVGDALSVGHGLAEEVALGLFAADVPQKVELLLGLHALGQGLNANLLGHVDDGGEDALGAQTEVTQKVHIDFELVELKILQRVQGGVTAAEVVHPHGVTGVAELGDAAEHRGLVVGEHALGDLDADVEPRHLVGAHGLLHHGEDVAQLKVQPGQVQGDGHHNIPPGHGLPIKGAHLPDDMGVQQMDEAMLLQHGDKGSRGQQAVLRVIPAGQCLHGAHLTGDSAHHGLKINFDMLLLQSGVQVLEDILSRDGIQSHISERSSSRGRG